MLFTGTGANAGVSATQDGLEPAVALAVAEKGGDFRWPEGRRAVRLEAFPKARHNHVQKR